MHGGEVSWQAAPDVDPSTVSPEGYFKAATLWVYFCQIQRQAFEMMYIWKSVRGSSSLPCVLIFPNLYNGVSESKS